MKFHAFLVCLLLAAPGCAFPKFAPTDSTQKTSRTEPQFQRPAPFTPSAPTSSAAPIQDRGKNETQLPIVKDYIGLTEEDAIALAEKQKRPYRVGWRDGKGLYGTADYAFGRITFRLTKGIVTSAKLEPRLGE